MCELVHEDAIGDEAEAIAHAMSLKHDALKLRVHRRRAAALDCDRAGAVRVELAQPFDENVSIERPVVAFAPGKIDAPLAGQVALHREGNFELRWVKIFAAQNLLDAPGLSSAEPNLPFLIREIESAFFRN